MKLTPLSKGILSLIVLAGVGSVGWNLYKQQAVAPAADPVNVEAPAQTNGNPVAAQPATPAAAAPVNAAQSGFNSYQSIVEKGVVRVSVQAPSRRAMPARARRPLEHPRKRPRSAAEVSELRGCY